MSASLTIWDRIDAMVEQSFDRSVLERHRLELLAAHRLRATGRDVDPELLAAERVAAMRSIAAPQLLRRIREVATGPLILMKGPEAGASYPRPHCRPFKDLDLLTSDADRLYSDLVAAGFQTVSGAAAYHLPGLAWPGLPLAVEVHRIPHYIPGLPAPETAELLPLTQASRTGVPGILGLEPAAHAVLLAAHAWAHGPLERVGHLLDVAAVLADGDPAAAEALSRRWGCARMWTTTTAAIDTLLRDAPVVPLALRTWARHLASLRQPSILESYAARILGPAWALPRHKAARGMGSELCRTVLPYEGESWTSQLGRARHAVVRAFHPVSEQRL